MLPRLAPRRHNLHCDHVVRPVAPVAQQPREVDVREVRVGAAFGRRDANFRWRRVVVELDEEALEQMELLGHSFFVYRDHELQVRVIYRRADGRYGVIITA